ncbi:MAG: carboxymuconolactone decarboxylase family protein [Arcobacter sp.]|uniref:carboxymuconolactone decarboxylase family protein n=1 Tax=Arcobacter sp. TaxID=1872629 RepID=UPI003C7736F7
MRQLVKLFLFLPLFIFANESMGSDKIKSLNKKEQTIIPISAFTANGDLEKLKLALDDGLNAGLSINEINEIIVHLYAYAGFPRSLNSLGVFMELINERKEIGIKDELGKEASKLPDNFDKDDYGSKVRAKLAGREKDFSNTPWQNFSPAIDTFLKEHLFADIFARDLLDYKTRELITISALAAINGTTGQLKFHIPASMNMGLTKGQLEDFILILNTKVGRNEAKTANDILQEVLKTRK